MRERERVIIRIVNTTVRLPVDLRDTARRAAKQQGETYSSFMRHLLSAFLREQNKQKVT